MAPALHPLSRAREGAGLTQAQLAARLATTQQQVNRWEAQGREPSASTAVRIARALDTSVEAIWGRDDLPTSEARAVAAAGPRDRPTGGT